MLDPALLEIIVCPRCKGELTADEELSGLICGKCRLLYPVRDRIPILLISEAAPLPIKNEEKC